MKESAIAEHSPAPLREPPGFWKMMWMFWMQPVLLHRRLRECGIEEPGELVSWVRRAPSPVRSAHRQYSFQMLGMVGLLTPIAVFAAGFLLDVAGIPISYQLLTTAAVTVTGFSVGFVIALSLAAGKALVVTFAIAMIIPIATGYAIADGRDTESEPATDHVLTKSLPFSVAFGAGYGISIGVAISVSYSFAVGTHVSSRTVVMVSIGIGLAAAIAIGAKTTPSAGLRTGLSATVASLLTMFRIPVFAVEAGWSIASILLGRTGQPTLRYAPVRFHDLSYLPLPGLRSQLTTESPALVRSVLEDCQRSPGQRETGEAVLATLKVRELQHRFENHDFNAAARLEGEWLAGADESDVRLQRLAETGRYMAAAAIAVVARHRLQHLDASQRLIAALRNQLLSDRSTERTEFLTTLEAVEAVQNEMHGDAIELAAGQLPNAFRAGDPLQPELGQETFRGREELITQIEVLLNDDRQSAAIAVRAPRRCGKSSLLQMLPVKLPDALCVFFDLQDNPIPSPAGLFPALAKRTLEQARLERGDDLPEMHGESLEAARDWLEALDRRPGNDRVLLCLDEFERLEDLVGDRPETRQELIQVMGLLRATIQHRRRVRLLVAGAATFEELGELWNDTFISAQELRLGPLEREVALELLCQPIPEEEGFPSDAIPLEVAEAIVERTGGQPYLTQLYGFWLVEELNRTKQRKAELSDVETIDDIVCDKAGFFFRDYLAPRGATFEVREVIEQIVAGESPQLTPSQKRFLVRRGLINGDGTLAFPILARWLTDYAE